MRVTGCLLVALTERAETCLVPRPRARATMNRGIGQRKRGGEELPTRARPALDEPESRHRGRKTERIANTAGSDVPAQAVVHGVSARRDPRGPRATIAAIQRSRRMLNKRKSRGDGSRNLSVRQRRAARTGKQSAHECNTDTTMVSRHGSAPGTERSAIPNYCRQPVPAFRVSDP